MLILTLSSDRFISSAQLFLDRKVHIVGVKTTPPQSIGFRKVPILASRAGINADLFRLARSITVFISEIFISYNLMRNLIYLPTLSVKSKLAPQGLSAYSLFVSQASAYP